MEPVPRLSCERCKRRKIRCDKRSPCSACVNLGSECNVVQRARLPRGRSVNIKKNALEERVARLESLLKQVREFKVATAGSQITSIKAPLPGSRVPGFTKDLPEQKPPSQFSGRVNEFLAPEFWATISVEVAGLRETLDESDDDPVTCNAPLSGSTSARLTAQTLLSGRGHNGIGSAKCPAPSEEIRDILLQLYRERVDCLYKALHWPTVLADIHRLHNGEQDISKASSYKALEHSIYFMSLCSITDEEASSYGLGHRTSLIKQYLEAAERAIFNAGLLQQPNVITLQAFVIYLLGYRTFHSSATAWTLLAVAVRAGTALRLGQEDPRIPNSLELQIRRRLWYCIALMDTHASFDRGTIPMIQWKDLGPQPLLVNDDDISSRTVPKASSSHFNDMSFFSLMIQAMVTHKKILSMPDNVGGGFAAQLHEVLAFERSTEKEYFHIRPNAAPLEKFAQQAAKGIIAGMHLAIRRPPYKQYTKSIPSADDFDILAHAVYVLQQDSKKKSSEYAPWAWKSWVQWHALAIALAELCSRPPTEDHEVSYCVAVEGFHRYATVIADSDKGMLWRPIAKLMRRVEQIRANRTLDGLPKHASPSSDGCLDSLDQRCGSSRLSNTADLATSMNLDLYMMDSSQNWFTDLGDSFIPGVESCEAVNDDAQLSWSTFMGDVDMDYSINFQPQISYFDKLSTTRPTE